MFYTKDKENEYKAQKRIHIDKIKKVKENSQIFPLCKVKVLAN